MLHWLAFVACNAAAAAVLLPLLAARRRATAASAEAAPLWVLSLVHASLVSVEEDALQEVEAEVELELGGEAGAAGAAPQLPEAFMCAGRCREPQKPAPALTLQLALPARKGAGAIASFSV